MGISKKSIEDRINGYSLKVAIWGEMCALKGDISRSIIDTFIEEDAEIFRNADENIKRILGRKVIGTLLHKVDVRTRLINCGNCDHFLFCILQPMETKDDIFYFDPQELEIRVKNCDKYIPTNDVLDPEYWKKTLNFILENSENLGLIIDKKDAEMFVTYVTNKIRKFVEKTKTLYKPCLEH